MTEPTGDPHEAPTVPDPRAVLARLARLANRRQLSWPASALPVPPPRPPVSETDALAYLHDHWVLPDQPPAAAGRGWRRVARTLTGRLVFSALAGYLSDERELLSRLVQVVDVLARRIDALESDLHELTAATSRHIAELAAYVPALEGADAGEPAPQRSDRQAEDPPEDGA